TQLLKAFLQFVDRKKLIICIDDIDLVDNDIIYNMLEDIRKNFSENILVILAYRSEQLNNSILSSKIEKERNLIEKGQITVDEVREQVGKYVQKLIPLENMVYLFDAEYHYTQKIALVMESIKIDNIQEFIEKHNQSKCFEAGDSEDRNVVYLKKLDGETSVIDWIVAIIYLKTRIRIIPVDAREKTANNFPNNLRGMLQLLELADQELEVVAFTDNSDNSDSIAMHKVLLKNIRRYRRYMIELSKEGLSYELSNYIAEWGKTEAENKNFYIYRALSERLFARLKNNSMDRDEHNAGRSDRYRTPISEHEKLINSLLNCYQVEPYNISIGDVYDIFEHFKRIEIVKKETFFFVYIMKIIYSMELLEQYIQAKIESDFPEERESNEDVELMDNRIEDLRRNNFHLLNYLSLINVKISPTIFDYRIGSPVMRYYKYVDPTGLYNNFINKVSYSVISISGNISRETRYMGTNTRKIRNSALKYRNYFCYFASTDYLNDNSEFLFDPYAFLGKIDYIKNIIETQDKYVFYSLFDIDKLVRVNYNRSGRVKDSRTEQMLKKVNEVFTVFKRGRIKYNRPLEGYLYIEALKNDLPFEQYEWKFEHLHWLVPEEEEIIIEEYEEIAKNKEMALEFLDEILALDILKEMAEKANILKRDIRNRYTSTRKVRLKQIYTEVSNLMNIKQIQQKEKREEELKKIIQANYIEEESKLRGNKLE
ncbi:MAG: hypothetical protein ACRC6X_08635, partial [Culicoidibacterales bacterium]